MAGIEVRRLPSGAEMAKKMMKNLGNSGDAWQQGALHPRKDPIDAALKSAPKHKQRTLEALQKGSYEKGLAKVDKAAMAETISKTPSSAVHDGVMRRESKVIARFEKLGTIMAENVAVLDKMPTGTESEREAKVIANLKLQRAVKDRMRA